MKAAALRVALLGSVLASAACSRTEIVAEGPIELGTTPREIAFSHPVIAHGPRELCMDFPRPGDSRNAGTVHAVLITAEGRRDTLHAPSLDRRGEAIVCLVATNDAPPATYRAALLWSDAPVRLRALRWYGGRAPS